MSSEKTWVDAHCHLADSRIKDVSSIMAECRKAGIGYFLQGGVGPEDWKKQLELATREPGILPVFGLHPYWVADHDQKDCEEGLDQLARALPKAAALGETGLDFRTSIIKDSRERQIGLFEAQLEIARFSDKAVILHVVRAFEESLQVLDLFGKGTRGLVHAFTGSWDKAKAYLDRGYCISVGAPILSDQALRLQQAVAAIPLSRLLIETDSPDQGPEGTPAASNTPLTLLRVAEKVAAIKATTASLVLDKSRSNLAEMMGRWNSMKN